MFHNLNADTIKFKKKLFYPTLKMYFDPCMSSDEAHQFFRNAKTNINAR